MPVRSDRTIAVILLYLLAHAGALLCYRFFLTLDGPMHVLHACALKSAWFSGRYATPYVDYWIVPQGVDLGDLLLVPITWLFDPVTAHAVAGALVLAILTGGAWWVARGAGTVDPALFLWVLPFSFSFPFVLGFFNFLLAFGLALVCMGWWMRRSSISGRTLVGLFVMVIVCQAAHRSGGAMAILLVGSLEAMLLIQDRAGWRERWSGMHPGVRHALPAAMVLAAIAQVTAVLLVPPRTRVPGEATFAQGLFQLRPLLLFDRADEAPLLLALGGLLILTLVWAVYHRLRTRTISPRSDALLLSALVLLGASLVLRTPNADLLYFGTRLQTLAMLLLAAWAAVVVPFSRWSLALGALVLVVHLGRMITAEHRMAGSRPTYERAMEVVERLPLHGVTLPVIQDDNWMHEHLSAFVAASYEGVLFHSGDHLAFRHAPGSVQQEEMISFGYPAHLSWLGTHVEQGRYPQFDHIVLFGEGRPAGLRTRNVRQVLSRYYFLQWTNGYAQVWALRDERNGP